MAQSLPQFGTRVFALDFGWALKVLKNILRLNDIPDANLYTFRHTFASHLVKSGADLVAIKELMGHQSITTTEKYLHVGPKRAREAVESLNYD